MNKEQKDTPEYTTKVVEVTTELLDILKKLNYAFYVDGTSKALKPIMALTKDVIAKAEGIL